MKDRGPERGRRGPAVLRRRPVVFWALFALAAPVVLTPYVHSHDGTGYYAPLRSAVIDGDLRLANERAHFAETFASVGIDRDPATGVYYSQYPIGTALLWLPFFLAGHAIALLGAGAPTGYSAPYVAAVCLGSALLGAAGLDLCHGVCRRRFGRWPAEGAVLGAWLASPVFYYMFLEPTMAHAASLFAVALFATLWLRDQPLAGARRGLAAGLVTGLVVLVRYQNVVFWLLPPLAAWAAGRRGDGWRVPPCAVAGLVAGLAVVGAPQMLVLQFQHGFPLPLGSHYGGRIDLLQGLWNWLRVLFSSNHGLLVWTPVWAMGLIGLGRVALRGERAARREAALLAAAFAANLLLVASLSSWNGAQSFGHRMFVGATPVLAFGLAALLAASRRPARWAAGAAVVALVAWNGGLMLQYGSRMIPSKGPVPISTIARNNLVVVPRRAGAIVHRFLFERDSLVPGRGERVEPSR